MSMAAGSPGLEKNVGNFVLIDTLRQWGVHHYTGVNGGGVVHVSKYLEPLTDPSQITDGRRNWGRVASPMPKCITSPPSISSP